jgi:GT2 family glycosyltransferase
LVERLAQAYINVMPGPSVIAVVLNTNRRDDTLACLKSLYTNAYPNLHVIVLDNASTDGSIEAIRSTFAQVQLVGLKQNLGYAGNNNVGIRLAVEQGADWVFVLNEDTVLANDCISSLIASVQADGQIGMVGPMVYHFDEKTVIQSAGGFLDKYWTPYLVGINEEDEGQFSTTRSVDWLSGCALLVRRTVIEQVGVLDERLFIYWEETDWCLRARAGGWRLVNSPTAKVWHKGVQRNYQPSPSVTYYFTRNKFLVLLKNHAPFTVLVYHFLQTFRTLISWSIRPRWRFMLKHRNAMLQGMRDFLNQRWGMRPG